MKKITGIFSIILCLFYSCAFGRSPRIDSEVSAIESGDFTALVEGCGNQLVSGYTYCRKYEGTSAEEEIYFFGPQTNCKREFCVEFKIYMPDGSTPYGDSISKKKHRKAVKWKSLLRKETFEFGDTGFWPFNYRVYWNDKDGNEHVSISQGEIRLRVIKKEYTPLNEVKNDSNFAWIIRTKKNEVVKITTGMRTFVSTRKSK